MHFILKCSPFFRFCKCRFTTSLLSHSSSGRETHPSAARIGDKKAYHGQKEYGRAGEDSPQPGKAMDEPLLFHLPGDQLAHLNEVLGFKILQAKKAEGCV